MVWKIGLAFKMLATTPALRSHSMRETGNRFHENNFATLPNGRASGVGLARPNPKSPRGVIGVGTLTLAFTDDPSEGNPQSRPNELEKSGGAHLNQHMPSATTSQDEKSYQSRLAKFWIPLVTVLMASVLYNRIPLHRGGNQAQASYIISGSFKSSSLYVLRYDRENKKLEVVHWKEPPHLSAWSIQVDHPGGVHPRLSLINQAPITAVSSYITSKHGLLFSAGGPTGEIHQLNQDTGAIEKKLQELLFVPAEALHNEDKSRKALRNGSHAIEISSLDEWSQLDMGIQPEFSKEIPRIFVRGQMSFNPVMDLAIQSSVRTGEGSSRVDLYHVTPSGIVHQASSSVIGEPLEHSKYRGDTVRILPSSFLYSSTDHEYIFATTRGIDYSQHGQLAVFKYDMNTGTLDNLIRWETQTSGGKANAVEFSHVKLVGNKVELVLTDDEVGWVSILECDLDKRIVTVISSCLIDQEGIGASHAVWI
ncbi:hypothetical protein PSHT_03498 [Puccinia striiformis]|uniref:Uncharacterized protein n=1 Tax=Puccinia striiformis TaxID=27350 RepID=A0A2S4WFE9_9BASI|nr:hypothetical protein PSHT_03498 [Puccinia striiformis]